MSTPMQKAKRRSARAAKRIKRVWVEVSSLGHIVGCYPSKKKARYGKWPDSAIVPFDAAQCMSAAATNEGTE